MPIVTYCVATQHGGVPDLRQVLGEDCSCVLEEFFHLVHSCAVFHPDLLLRTRAAGPGPGPGEAVLSDTLRIASQSLSLCRERDPLVREGKGGRRLWL